MKAREIVTVGVVSTSFMSLFSYVLSEITDDHFREPEILGQLLQRLIPVIKKKYAKVLGWNAHYLVGILFAAVYIYLWREKGIKPTVENGLIFGGISGLIAIAVWKFVLKMHPLPPWLKFNKFYLQLFPAHLILGLSAVATFKANQPKEN